MIPLYGRKLAMDMYPDIFNDRASVCREYLKSHPNASVVNIGCSLDTTFRQVDNGTAKGYNIDFPDGEIIL